MKNHLPGVLGTIAVSATLLVPFGVGPAQAATGASPGQVDASTQPADAGATPSGVYAMTNGLLGNSVVVYARRADGTLAAPRSYATGGRGSGVIDQSGNSLILAGDSVEMSPDNLGGSTKYLFTVNTGSNSVASFRVQSNGLKLADVGSGLDHPISVTYNNHRLFVLNATKQSCIGGNPTITGFTVADNGKLTPIPGSTRPVVGGALSGCTQISFNPRGDVIVVSEKINNSLSTYTIGQDNIPNGPIYNKPTGVDPFGYSFTRQNQLVTAENYGSLAGGVSTYNVPSGGTLGPISPSVLTTRNDSCWVVITNDQKRFYVTNAVSGDITSYTLDRNGDIAVLQPIANLGGLPIPMAFDEALSADSQYLYVRSITLGSIYGYKVQTDGSLVQIQVIGGLPPLSAEGIAAR